MLKHKILASSVYSQVYLLLRSRARGESALVWPSEPVGPEGVGRGFRSVFSTVQNAMEPRKAKRIHNQRVMSFVGINNLKEEQRDMAWLKEPL